MNSLTTDGFYAERQRNGDVWITSRSRKWTRHVDKLAPVESEPVIIPADKCRELTELLLRGMSDSDFKSTIRTVDYNRSVGSQNENNTD